MNVLPFVSISTNTMNAHDRERLEALELVLKRHQLFPPSSDELHRAMQEALPLIRKKK